MLPKKQRETKKETKGKGLFNKNLLRLVTVAVFIGCGLLIYTTYRDCRAKEQEVAELQEKIDAYNEENTELQMVLDSDDMSEYMERVALERGYAYSDERRFYDTSRKD